MEPLRNPYYEALEASKKPFVTTPARLFGESYMNSNVRRKRNVKRKRGMLR